MNKSNYIDKPFSYLLSNMIQIKPKSVNSLPKVWGKDLTPYSIFKFCDVYLQYGKLH